MITLFLAESNTISTYDYVVDYYTYYGGPTLMELPLIEVVQTNTLGLMNTREVSPDMYMEAIKLQINNKVKNKKYPGLWVHHICVKLTAENIEDDITRKQQLVVTSVDTSNIKYSSDQLSLPSWWDKENPDINKLSRYAINKQERS